MLSLAAILAEAAARHGGRIAVVEGSTHLTYSQLWRSARARAAVLTTYGVVAGDRVALVCANTIDFPATYFAVLTLGAVVVPVAPMLTGDEVAHVLRDSNATLIVAADEFTSAAEVGAAGAGVAALGLSSLATQAVDAHPVADYVAREPGDVAVILYTSGTTGKPKGAALTQLNLVLNATVHVLDTQPMTSDDVLMGCLPLFHTFGQTAAMNSAFRVGATLVLLPRFDADECLDLMGRHGVTLLLGVPTMFSRMLAAAEHRNEVPVIAQAVCGGAPLPLKLLHAFQDRFGTVIHEGYGLSETSPIAAANQDAFGTRPGTVGHPLWGTRIAIARPEVTERIELLGVDEVGEVVVQGPNVFAGYIGNSAATAEALVDGWFRTGDLGARDADGFLRIVDRSKDLVIRGGFNVYPREVEEVLIRHPAVAQVAVIGVPHDDLGEEVCAVVVPVPGVLLNVEELIAWSRGHLGAHKYPRLLHTIDELPLGPSHKVLKRELRTRFAPA